MRKTILLLLLGVGLTALAQQFSPERTGGVYYAYPVEASERIAAPKGYEPFYISHYGRHGSRWLPSAERYEWVMAQFGDDKNLTPLGRSVKKRLKKICKDAQDNAGQLTPLGATQHRQIARRMAKNYPEVFSGDDTRLLARSSTVPRCRASMLAFLSALPVRGVTGQTEPEFMAYLNHESAELKALSARTKRQPLVSPQRFVSALFRVSPYPGDDAMALRLLSELHTIASDMQDVSLNVSLWDIFTPAEMQAVHDANNERMALCNSDTVGNDGIAARSSIALWQNIVDEADQMIASGGHGASLRFGHDTALYRLLTLLQLELPGRGMEDFLPMAANLQMVFFRGEFLEGRGERLDFRGERGVVRGERIDSILVAFLLNERPVSITDLSNLNSQISTLKSQLSNLYSWEDVKAYMTQRVHQLEHLRQLNSLNTMVGTDQANTRTAGLFGKGSEEKGQTQPAVLVPNGQTFWTPQTQATERKCIAPYYYKDTLFHGIRASHWLVGGCTQDYGSFTVNASSASAGAATAFSHTAETSHPHYYAVTLPREKLLLELTGLSHAAILRVTPQQNGPVVITVTANSDEQEGGVSLDAARRQVYGFNPVHRIYQGWGERAGFSGHFVLQYADSLVDSSTQGQTLSLTFDGHRGQPIELRMATSFTSRQGAEANLHAEAGGSFWQMQQQCISRWTERLGTIGVQDPDTARVNQFYGALYRASFLPREMSDVDGSYPSFSTYETYNTYSTYPPYPPSPSPRFCDFSMWDTYRALHPLYNIIVPETSAQMMQSLVGMYEEGGWLPIFPCWNSYTAAMIGDHCSSVLADAYVKGIRGFDAQTAYEAMRRNAFEQPSPQEYLDGKGRRALGSYLRYGYIPLEDSVKEAFHQQEQTSRTLEYAYDDFCVAQLALAMEEGFGEGCKVKGEGCKMKGEGCKVKGEGRIDQQNYPPFTPHPSPFTPHPSPFTPPLREKADYDALMRRSENWRNVINPLTGYADGRHADGRWEGNQDLVHRQPYITEGATCHYTWYVPQNIPGLIELMGGSEAFTQKLDSMFTEGRYWHGNEPCHQVAWLYSLAGHPEKTRERVSHILQTEYNDTPGGLSGNDDAGQMSAWQLFAMMGFYPVCPATTQYVLGGAQFQQVTLNQPNGQPFVIRRSPDGQYRLNGQLLSQPAIDHSDLLRGGVLELP